MGDSNDLYHKISALEKELTVTKERLHQSENNSKDLQSQLSSMKLTMKDTINALAFMKNTNMALEKSLSEYKSKMGGDERMQESKQQTEWKCEELQRQLTETTVELAHLKHTNSELGSQLSELRDKLAISTANMEGDVDDKLLQCENVILSLQNQLTSLRQLYTHTAELNKKLEIETNSQTKEIATLKQKLSLKTEQLANKEGLLHLSEDRCEDLERQLEGFSKRMNGGEVNLMPKDQTDLNQIKISKLELKISKLNSKLNEANAKLQHAEHAGDNSSANNDNQTNNSDTHNDHVNKSSDYNPDRTPIDNHSNNNNNTNIGIDTPTFPTALAAAPAVADSPSSELEELQQKYEKAVTELLEKDARLLTHVPRETLWAAESKVLELQETLITANKQLSEFRLQRSKDLISRTTAGDITSVPSADAMDISSSSFNGNFKQKYEADIETLQGKLREQQFEMERLLQVEVERDRDRKRQTERELVLVREISDCREQIRELSVTQEQSMKQEKEIQSLKQQIAERVPVHLVRDMEQRCANLEVQVEDYNSKTSNFKLIEERCDQLQNQLKLLTDALESVNNANANLESDLAELTRQLQAKNLELQVADSRRVEQDINLMNLRQTLEQTRRHQDKQVEQLKQRLAQKYAEIAMATSTFQSGKGKGGGLGGGSDGSGIEIHKRIVDLESTIRVQQDRMLLLEEVVTDAQQKRGEAEGRCTELEKFVTSLISKDPEKEKLVGIMNSIYLTGQMVLPREFAGNGDGDSSSSLNQPNGSTGTTSGTEPEDGNASGASVSASSAGVAGLALAPIASKDSRDMIKLYQEELSATQIKLKAAEEKAAGLELRIEHMTDTLKLTELEAVETHGEMVKFKQQLEATQRSSSSEIDNLKSCLSSSEKNVEMLTNRIADQNILIADYKKEGSGFKQKILEYSSQVLVLENQLLSVNKALAEREIKLDTLQKQFSLVLSRRAAGHSDLSISSELENSDIQSGSNDQSLLLASPNPSPISTPKRSPGASTRRSQSSGRVKSAREVIESSLNHPLPPPIPDPSMSSAVTSSKSMLTSSRLANAQRLGETHDGRSRGGGQDYEQSHHSSTSHTLSSITTHSKQTEGMDDSVTSSSIRRSTVMSAYLASAQRERLARRTGGRAGEDIGSLAPARHGNMDDI